MNVSYKHCILKLEELLGKVKILESYEAWGLKTFTKIRYGTETFIFNKTFLFS